MLLQRSTRFKKQFIKLQHKIQIKTEERLNILLVNEFSEILNNHVLHGDYENCRSINITGDIRIIYKKMGNNILFLLEIGTHNQLYE